MRSASILLLLLFVTGCSSFDLLNATIPTGGYALTSNLTYGPDARQKLDVYVPKKLEANAPIVVFFYGGSWTSGVKEDYRFVAEAMTSRGFTAVMPDYRLLPEVKFPAFILDGAAAVRWARNHLANDDGSSRPLFLMGHSAGAYIAIALSLDGRYLNAEGLDRSIITATAGLSGPYAYIPPSKDRRVQPFPTTTDGTIAGGMDSIVGTDADWDLIQRVTADGPPVLLIHGLADDFVRPVDSTKLEQRLREQGGKVEARYYKNKDHVSTALSLARPFKWVAPTLADVTGFFRRHLKRSSDS